MAPFGQTGILATLAIGFSFGFTLERAGFGNARNLAAQFYLNDMRVLKVMFTAIVTAMVLTYWAAALGFLALEKVFVPQTYLGPVVLGGLVFGAGFIIGGYCPGTALVSTATGKLDGIFFLLGGMIGMFVFGRTVPSFLLFWERSGFHGRLTLPDWIGVDAGLVVLAVILMALGMFWGAEKVEALFAGGSRKS